MAQNPRKKVEKLVLNPLRENIEHFLKTNLVQPTPNKKHRFSIVIKNIEPHNFSLEISLEIE